MTNYPATMNSRNISNKEETTRKTVAKRGKSDNSS